MKHRIICALVMASAAVLSSCTKEEIPTNLVTVNFSYSLTEGRTITKSTETDFLLSLTPSTAVELTLTDAKGATYTTQTGRDISIPQGKYTVTYTPAPPTSRQAYNADAYFTQIPQIAIEQEVEITAGTTSVPLTAKYLSSAILFDLNEVDKIKMTAQTGSTFSLNYATGSGLGVLFFTGEITDRTCHLSVTGKEGFDNASIDFNTDGSNGGTILEQGKYYFLRLAGATTEAAFSFTVLDWTDGGSLT